MEEAQTTHDPAYDKSYLRLGAKLRRQLEEEGFFESSESESYFKLCRDVDFKSPSAAAAIVRNSSMNGRKEWKLKNGLSLDEFENRQ